MRYTLVISFLVHAGILLAAIVVLPQPDQYQVEDQESIPVEIVTLESESERAAGAPRTQDQETPTGPKPIKVEKRIDEIKDAPKPGEVIKQAARAPQYPDELLNSLIEATQKKARQIEPVVEEKPKPKEAETKPDEQVAAKQVPKPRRKPKPPKKKKPDFDPDELVALLDKSDDQRQAPPADDQTGTPLELDRPAHGPDDRVSANELDWLRQRIGQCWNIPTGVRAAENLIVKIHFQLDPGGNVTGQPAVLNTSNHPAFEAAARSALAAVLGCQPYDKLPLQKYESWKVIQMNFDPSKVIALN